ncbi:bacterial type II secretion system protein F domain protein [mine drainage metagenome]|uniref:Bacterial type II secretion system protein F domain protein n=1 Tax=mine drainage metagenome TaxID=410659 RepID=A0A1J5QN87_9ZZZZ
MSIHLMLYAAIVFAAVAAIGYALLSYAGALATRRRLQRATGARPYGDTGAGADWLVTLARLSGPLARLSLPAEGWENSALRRRFMHAGLRSAAAPGLYFAAKTALALALPALVWLLLAAHVRPLGLRSELLVLFAVATAGYYLPNLVLDRLVRRRQRMLFEAFPDAADLMLVCVEAGLGLDAALRRVADEIKLESLALAEELHLVNLETQAGHTRETAMRNLALRTGVDAVDAFATMMIQADRFGTSVGDSLRVFSEEMRTRRQLAAEETAARIPLKLLFPLVFFVFPAMLVVLLGPAVIQVYRVLLPALHGS